MPRLARETSGLSCCSICHSSANNGRSSSIRTRDLVTVIRAPFRREVQSGGLHAIPTRGHCGRRCGPGRAANSRPSANLDGRRRGGADNPSARAPRHRGERQDGVGLRHPAAKWDLWHNDRGRQGLSRPGRKRHWRAEPDPLARNDAAVAAGRGAGDFRTRNSFGRQRRLRFPPALRRHVLDAFPPGPAGADVDGRAAHHPRSARPRRRARDRGHAGRFQLHAA